MTNTQFERMHTMLQLIHVELTAIRAVLERNEYAANSDVTPANALAVLTEPDAPGSDLEVFEHAIARGSAAKRSKRRGRK